MAGLLFSIVPVVILLILNFMIDKKTIRFFQSLDKSPNTSSHFLESVCDIDLSKLDQMHQLAKTVNIPPRTRKRYRWYLDDHTGGFYSKDLCNIDGKPVHEYYNSLFNKVETPSLEWLPEYEPFKNSLAQIDKQWKWVMLVRIDPMGWWGPHINMPADKDKDYTLYWIPLNQVKNRFFASQHSGYFEPLLGKAYIQRGNVYEYSTINLGNEPMYNITGVCK